MADLQVQTICPLHRNHPAPAKLARLW